MAQEGELKKDLGLLSALMIGIGVMIGAGIFVLPGAAAAEAGPAAIAAFVVGGFIALFTALSISELGTAMPKAGGAYYYVSDGLGPLFGSIGGWGNWLGLAAATGFYLIGLGSYAQNLFPIPSVDLLLLTLTPAQVAALIAAFIFIGLNYVGTKETGSAQVVIVLTLLAILGVFSAVGFLEVNVDNLQPFAPAEQGGYTAILPAAGLIFVTYLGFAEINTAAEELKNPGRNLPLAVIGSLLIVTVLYALIIAIVIGIDGWETVAEFGDTAVADLAGMMLGTTGFILLTIGGLLATASSANASILASSRINFAMGRDRIITPKLTAVHPRYKTPYRAIALTGVLIIGFILIGDIETLAKAGSILHLIVYGLLNIALIVYREADVAWYDPDFRVPLYPYVPILGAVLSFGLIGFMQSIEIAMSLAFVLLGVLWYFGYARHTATKPGALARWVEDHPEDVPEPALSMVTAIEPDSAHYRVVVPVANPDRVKPLMELACTMASENEGDVHVINIVQLPEQTPLSAAREGDGLLSEDTEDILALAQDESEKYDVPVETREIVSRRGYSEIFDAVDRLNADLAVVGWGDETRWSAGQSQRGLRRAMKELPCDFLVFRADHFDANEVLVPTAGGPDSELSAAVARRLRDMHGATIRLLYVTGEAGTEEGEAFLKDWAADHDLEDAELIVDTSGQPATAIIDESEKSSVTILGATGDGFLSRALKGSVVWEIARNTDTPLILVEQPGKRSLRDRLF